MIEGLLATLLLVNARAVRVDAAVVDGSGTLVAVRERASLGQRLGALLAQQEILHGVDVFSGAGRAVRHLATTTTMFHFPVVTARSVVLRRVHC